MGDTWVTDIRHFLDDDGDFPYDLPGPALKLARYITNIIESLTSHGHQTISINTYVKCRRRPARKSCTGHIYASIQQDQSIRWYCNVCGNNGYITGWQGTIWDNTTKST